MPNTAENIEDVKAKGSPSWMTTFADLMSLLMCFFVMLLSYSEMDVEKFKQIPSVILAVQSKDREVPEYLTVDYIKMKGVFVKSPALKDVPYPVEMEPNLVVEFYSR